MAFKHLKMKYYVNLFRKKFSEKKSKNYMYVLLKEYET